MQVETSCLLKLISLNRPHLKRKLVDYNTKISIDECQIHNQAFKLSYYKHVHIEFTFQF